MNLTSLKIISCSLLLATVSFAQNTGAINGTVTDIFNDEGLPFANVTLEQNGIQITATQTDFDGHYSFSQLDSGLYNLIVSYVGFPTNKEENILVKPNEITLVDIDMEEEGVWLDEVSCVVVKRSFDYVCCSINRVGSSKKTKRRPRARVKNKSKRKSSNSKIKKSQQDATHLILVDGIPQEVDAETFANYQKETSVPEEKSEEGKFVENDFLAAKKDPFSTFSIDVDRASYSQVRSQLNQNKKPSSEIVRIEEMVNYFNYDYAQPKGDVPFSVITELSDCPWNSGAKLLQVALKGKDIELKKAVPNNLVFLIDVSGSMSDQNKLPLLKESLRLLVNEMREEDKIAIVVYAGAAGMVLPSTNDKKAILESLTRLGAGGSTNGSEGINLAYEIAQQNFIKNGNNRIILATDGDFNVGLSSEKELEKLIAEKRKSNIFLTTLGFGMGNFKDATMELLADKGNGNYSYIDNINEGHKTLVKEMGGTLYAVAKDVKIQVQFAPSQVLYYRLVGYENRMLKKADFRNDKKDAGDLGAGHSVTAFYEVVFSSNVVAEKEMLKLRFRYKLPKKLKSNLLESPINYEYTPIKEASEDFRFAASVAGFGMLLRDSKFKNNLSYENVLNLAKDAQGEDIGGYREEFINMVQNASSISLQAEK